MRNNKNKSKGRRPFDRAALFPHKPIPESIAVRQSLVKAFPCRFCQKSYLDSMIEELDRLIGLKQSRVAIVDTSSGKDMSSFHGIMAILQGNGYGFK